MASLTWLGWRWRLALARYHLRRLHWLALIDPDDSDLVARIEVAEHHTRTLECGRP